jgi:hypothetical protein
MYFAEPARYPPGQYNLQSMLYPPPPPRRYPAADLTADPAIHVQFRALARRI